MPRPKGAKDKEPRAPRGGQKPPSTGEPPESPAPETPAKPATAPDSVDANRIDLDELKKLFPEATAAAEGVDNLVEFDPETLEQILALGFSELTAWVLHRFERKEITEDQAKAWAKCTRMVYGHYLKGVAPGITIHALLTVGILAGRPKLPPKKEPTK